MLSLSLSLRASPLSLNKTLDSILCKSISPNTPIQASIFHPTIICSLSPPQPQPRLSSKHAAVVEPPSQVYGHRTVDGGEEEKDQLPPGMFRESMPKHVAVVMDGNRRWARMRGLPAEEGYKAGVNALKFMTELCSKWNIRVLTVFAFSSQNWLRPRMEVDFLINLFERVFRDDIDEFVRGDIRISVIGDPSKLPVSLQKLIRNIEEATKNNSRVHLVVAVSYSGQYDIVQACQSIAIKVKDGIIEPQDIDEALIEQELQTNCTAFHYPDLLIRTSGELRVSNFLLWQLAYTELFFSQSHWPDFGEAEFLEALYSFQRRQRKYGG